MIIVKMVYANEIEFTVEKSRRLVIEITVPGDGGGGSTTKKKSKLLKSSDMGCVGILVEHMTTPISGFYGIWILIIYKSNLWP